MGIGGCVAVATRGEDSGPLLPHPGRLRVPPDQRPKPSAGSGGTEALTDLTQFHEDHVQRSRHRRRITHIHGEGDPHHVLGAPHPRQSRSIPTNRTLTGAAACRSGTVAKRVAMTTPAL